MPGTIGSDLQVVYSLQRPLLTTPFLSHWPLKLSSLPTLSYLVYSQNSSQSVLAKTVRSCYCLPQTLQCFLTMTNKERPANSAPLPLWLLLWLARPAPAIVTPSVLKSCQANFICCSLTEMLFPQIHSLNGPLPPSGLYSNAFFSERSSPTTLCNLPLTPLLTCSQDSLSSFHHWAHYTFYLYYALYVSPSYYIQNISSSG